MRKSPSGAPLDVTILGTGDAFASRGRFQSGYMVEADGCRILMEAGPTVICAMKRLNFAPADIDLILISHLHGDHFAGLPFLLLDYVWEKPRRTNSFTAPPSLSSLKSPHTIVGRLRSSASAWTATSFARTLFVEK